MGDLYPFEDHFLEMGGLKHHYLDEGQGDPVVMVHGNPSWSFYYRDLAGALRDRYRVIVPDHIGCGLSDKPSAADYPYTLERRVEDLDRLLHRLDVTERITLVVHDWGGMIGMAYAARHPERIARLVILNTAAFHLPVGKNFPLALRICRDTALGRFLVLQLNLFARMAAKVGCKRNPMPAQLRNSYCAPYNTPANRIATLRFVQDIPLAPEDPGFELISEVAASLTVFANRPMLICWGLKDFVFDQHFLKEWQRRFPMAEVHAFADCGHYILEDAKDEVIPIIDNFLKAHPIAQPCTATP
ncbi:MAG: alpha/beta hydrolase [Desulfuromonas sp.]|nr:MAG: alpha/beta hydrolase [Desulfuromonas sp.]